MKKIRINIQNRTDRENVALALIRAGYSVRIDVETNLGINTYWVCFTIEERNILNEK